MIKRILMLLLAAVLLLTAAACSSGTAQTLTENDDSYEDEPVEVPGYVQNLSEEDNILLNGELEGSTYTNRYFGYRLALPEGTELYRMNDNATDTSVIIPLADAVADGFGGVIYLGKISEDEDIQIFIRPRAEEELGLSEEEVTNRMIGRSWDLNRLFEVEAGPELRSFVIAGEEHPCSYSVEANDFVFVNFYFLKNEFVYDLYFSMTEAHFQELMSCLEKI